MGITIIDNAIVYIEKLFQNNADGHDVAHTLRVYQNTLMIANEEPECDQDIAALAALLHDVDDHKLFKTKDNANARRFMEENQLSQDAIERICHIINGVSFSQNRGRCPDSIEGKVVQDADRLDAMGAIGIARTFAYGGRKGRTLEDSVQHFYEKLLLLKEEMNTQAALRIAEERHVFMEQFLRELNAEGIL